jgi:hypothetical protein
MNQTRRLAPFGIRLKPAATIDVHQPVLVDADIDKGAERGDVRHDTLKNHAGPQILELFHPLAEASLS